MGNIGNTFGSGSVSTYGHARKVWREIRHQFPAGGTVKNLSDWTSVGIIPAGTPCKFDMAAKEIVAYTDSAVTGEEEVSSLGINGYLQEDIPLGSGVSVATGTVIYDGELYEWMLKSEVVSALKAAGVAPQVVLVR